uniref:CARD domain-containing protein n=1 Tax=Mesocestoides corti TaxID=53468 RepID=A0A5K3EY85_MESCO
VHLFNGTAEAAPCLSPSLNTYRQSSKHNRLSRSEILNILNDLVLEVSLVDYMVAHGVISASSARELLQVQGKGTNGIEKLLDLLGSECDTPQHYTQDAKLVLLTNALRSTGQHALASRLDCGRKIKPAPPTDAKLDSNEYGCGSDAAGGPASPTLRRRGQLSLWVQVAAIRLSPVYYEQLVPPPSPPQRRKKRLVPLTNATLEDGVVVQNLMETSHGAYFWIDLRSSSVKPLSPEHVTSTPLCETSTLKSQESAVSRFLCFVCCVRKRHKQSAQQPPPPTGTIDGPRASVDYRLPSSVLPLSPPTQSIKEATPEPPKVSKEREQEERLRRMKLAILDAKSSDFYAGLANPLSDAVVKFLEQTLGVLVLGARVESRCPVDCLPQGLLQPLSAAATVSIVATTCEALERLHAAVTLLPQENSHLPPSSALSTALESIFRQEVGFLESIDIQDVRLSVGLQEEEVKLAANELAE